MFFRNRSKAINKAFYSEWPNGYQDSVDRGIKGLRSFKLVMTGGHLSEEESIKRLKEEIETAEAIVIGAGYGLSAAAGLKESQFLPGGTLPEFETEEEKWAWWARNIYFNRYVDPPKALYSQLFELVKDKNYFVITTNPDGQFTRAGFDEKKVFYADGDLASFRSTNIWINDTFENKEWTMQAMEALGYVKNQDGIFQLPEGETADRNLPSELIPKCPLDDSKVEVNLRLDKSFVEDEEWHRASAAYGEFLEKNRENHTLFWEIGVGIHQPTVIKYPFWQMTWENPEAVYACLNLHEAYCLEEIDKQSICIEGEAGEVIKRLKGM